MKKLLWILILVVIVAAVAYFVFPAVWQRGARWWRGPLPTAQPYRPTATVPAKPRASLLPTQTTGALPATINLAIPFTSQAPFGNWDPPYGEFCEEASVLMVASYINSWTIPDAATADQKLLAIKAFEEQRFGYYQDTNAEQTAIILREFYGLKAVRVMPDPTVTDIKTALAQSKAVIVPAAGRELSNPHFRQPGPIYHMLVIKGYKNSDFITNDPGTRVGADYIYSQTVIMNAMHDWANGSANGRKVIIIVG